MCPAYLIGFTPRNVNGNHGGHVSHVPPDNSGCQPSRPCTRRRLVTAITAAGDVLALTEALKANEARRGVIPRSYAPDA